MLVWMKSQCELAVGSPDLLRRGMLLDFQGDVEDVCPISLLFREELEDGIGRVVHPARVRRAAKECLKDKISRIQ